MTIYGHKVKTSQGDEIPLSRFPGKTLLIVNTATKCGLAPQFRGLEDLHQKYKERGLVVIGFPCNQFLNQEPVSNEGMKESCELNFGVSFQLTEIIDVNGRDTHPVFNYLKDELPGKFGKRIKWNFTKFLISPEGRPVKRYNPTTKPESLENDIIEMLPVPAAHC